MPINNARPLSQGPRRHLTVNTHSSACLSVRYLPAQSMVNFPQRRRWGRPVSFLAVLHFKNIVPGEVRQSVSSSGIQSVCSYRISTQLLLHWFVCRLVPSISTLWMHPCRQNYLRNHKFIRFQVVVVVVSRLSAVAANFNRFVATQTTLLPIKHVSNETIILSTLSRNSSVNDDGTYKHPPPTTCAFVELANLISIAAPQTHIQSPHPPPSLSLPSLQLQAAHSVPYPCPAAAADRQQQSSVRAMANNSGDEQEQQHHDASAKDSCRGGFSAPANVQRSAFIFVGERSQCRHS